jgi:hypothetical protein
VDEAKLKDAGACRFEDRERVANRGRRAEAQPRLLSIPLEVPTWKGHAHHLEPINEGFLTVDDFATLYQASSEVLYTRNPCREDDPTIQVKYTVAEWISGIQALLSWHEVVLPDGGSWVVHIPPTGPVQAFPKQPADAPGANTRDGRDMSDSKRKTRPKPIVSGNMLPDNSVLVVGSNRGLEG